MNVRIVFCFLLRAISCVGLDLLKDCEVRAGLKSDTWIKVLRTGKVREQQVRKK